MSNTDHYRHLLASAASMLGFEDVKPDDNGHCTLQMEDTFVSFTCPEESSQLSLVIPVAEIQGECPRSVLELLLGAHLFFKDTRGGTFSYDKNDGLVLLHLNLLVDAIDESMLCNAVQNMMDVARRFAEQITEILASEGSGGSSEESQAPQDADLNFLQATGGLAV